MSNKNLPVLNKEQLEAVNTIKGNLLIIASAGTGKTTTIVERYVNMIQNHGYRPDEILMTTFTNKAAKDMVSKIVKRTKFEPPYVGTMHSLFMRILRVNAQSIGLNPYFTLLDNDLDKKKIIKLIAKNEGIDPRADNISYLLRWIGKFKNRGILAENLSENLTIEDIKEKGFIEEALDDEIIRIDPQLRKKVNKVYKKYEAELRKQNLLDFDDILIFTKRLFETNKEVRDYYSQKFKAIMVDEAQDLNVVQIDIIGLIQNDNLCVIGDECQNIYEWRGSSPELVFSFNEKQKKIVLQDNYRSGKKIISSVNKVINAMKFKIDKQLNCTKESDGKIKIEEFSDFEEEKEYIVNKIKKLLKEGVSKADIAVLFRINSIGKELERELKKNKIPCHLSKSVNFFEREEVKDILSFLRLKINPYSVIAFERILVLMNGFGKGTAKKFEEIAKQKTCSLIDSLKLHSEIKLSQDKTREVHKLISVIENFSSNPITLFLKDFGYLSILKSKYREEPSKLQDKLENIETIKELFEGHESKKEDIKNFLDGLIEIDKKEKTKDRVTLSTIHSAKGLEWENVFLASCNEKILPFYFRGELDPMKRDSELRLFYVAISRAKKSLMISHHETNGWGKEYERSSFIDLIE